MAKKRKGRLAVTISLDPVTADDLARYIKAVSKRDGHNGNRWGTRSQVVQKALKQYLHMQAAEVRF